MFNFFRSYMLRRQARRQMRQSAPRDRGTTWLLQLANLPNAIGRLIGLRFRTLLEIVGGRRRSMADLIWGIPAAIAFLGVGGLTAAGSSKQKAAGLAYLRAGQEQITLGNQRAAQQYLLKAIATEGADERLGVFNLARSYEAEKNFERADDLMSSVAPVGTIGHSSAHRYMAIRIDQNAERTKQPADLEAWEWHLTHADEQNSALVQKSWGDYYIALGDEKEALKHFTVAAETDPQYLFEVAELELRLNNLQKVVSTITSAKARLKTKMQREPDDIETRILYAGSLFHLGELPEAELVIRQSLDSDKITEEQRVRCKLFLSAVFIKMYTFYERQTGLTTSVEAAKAFLYLQNALEVAPDSQLALTKLVEFARGSKERLAAARDALRKLISQGNASAMAHFALGTVESIAGNNELALLNMRQGLAIDPKMAVLANNVAAMIAQTKDGDLDSALRLATQAIETSPTMHDYFDTRAGIHAKMNNLADAATDYQRALELAPDPRPYQLKLAELYDKMGDKELAAQYRESAKVESRPK